MFKGTGTLEILFCQKKVKFFVRLAVFLNLLELPEGESVTSNSFLLHHKGREL